MKKYRAWIPVALLVLVFVGLLIFLPNTAARSVEITWDYFFEMAFILPPVFILMGLMEVWIPKTKIQHWLGSKSGVRGAVLSVLLGTLPTGPLYIAFPMTASLIKKGASKTNMVLFLGSWAALKIPQLLVEAEFLGLRFTILRFVLTTTALVLTGLLVEFILKKSPDKKSEDAGKTVETDSCLHSKP
ncbi:MAG: permease [Clostridiales bacterium]|nr:permease [Clostridiales bacterium]